MARSKRSVRSSRLLFYLGAVQAFLVSRYVTGALLGDDAEWLLILVVRLAIFLPLLTLVFLGVRSLRRRNRGRRPNSLRAESRSHGDQR